MNCIFTVVYQLSERQSVEWDGRNFVSCKQVNYFRTKGRGLPYGTTLELYWTE